MSALPVSPTSRFPRRKAAALAAAALVGGLALLTGAPGASAQTPDGVTGQPPQIGALKVTPGTGLVDQQAVVITASAMRGVRDHDVAYSYYVSLCAGEVTSPTGDCTTVAGPLWPDGDGSVQTTAHLPAVVGNGADCRALPVCTVLAFPYRSPDMAAAAPVTFAPAAPAATPSTGPTRPAKPAKPVKTRPHFTG